MRRPLVAILLLSISICAVSQTPDPTPADGRISGVVTNEYGKPVPSAIVCARQDASSFVDEGCMTARTDVGGRFDFGSKLKHGVYELYARKEKDGYPDPTSKFYQPLNFNPESVQLFGDRPAEEIAVPLSEKAGVLTGRVFDSATGHALRAEVSLSNLRNGGGHGTVAEEGTFSELVPCDTDVIVIVENLADQQGWSIFRTKINLRPGQTMKIEVPLYKLVDDSPE